MKRCEPVTVRDVRSVTIGQRPSDEQCVPKKGGTEESTRATPDAQLGLGESTTNLEVAVVEGDVKSVAIARGAGLHISPRREQAVNCI